MKDSIKDGANEVINSVSTNAVTATRQISQEELGPVLFIKTVEQSNWKVVPCLEHQGSVSHRQNE